MSKCVPGEIFFKEEVRILRPRKDISVYIVEPVYQAERYKNKR